MQSQVKYPDDVASPYDLDLSPSQRAWLEAIEEKYNITEAMLHYYDGKPKHIFLFLENRENPSSWNNALATIGRSGKAEMKGIISEKWYEPSIFGIKTPILEKKKDCIEYSGEWEAPRTGAKISDWWIHGSEGEKCREYIEALNIYRGDPEDTGTYVSVYPPIYNSFHANGKFYRRAIDNTLLQTQGKYPDKLADIHYEYFDGEERWHIYDGDIERTYTVETTPATTKKQLVSRMMDVMLQYFRE